MLRWFKKKTLDDILHETKKVKFNGVTFVIRKVNPMDHLTGLNVIQKVYDIYKVNKSEPSESALENLKKVQKYSQDILLAGVVVPKLSPTETGEGFYVEKLFQNMELASFLTREIMLFTYKKKSKRVKSTSTETGL